MRGAGGAGLSNTDAEVGVRWKGLDEGVEFAPAFYYATGQDGSSFGSRKVHATRGGATMEVPRAALSRIPSPSAESRCHAR